jgi:protein-tyrosine phosphatase
VTTGRPLSVVVVCTANRFRSPLAAAVLERELKGLPIEVTSRGVRDVGAMPPLPQALDSASRLGIDVSRHRARAFRAEELRDADLVIGFEEAHLLAAREAGTPAANVFGLAELVTLLERLDRRPKPGPGSYISSVRSTLTEADRLRDPASAKLEIEDPVRKSSPEAAAIADRIHTLSCRLARLLTP